MARSIECKCDDRFTCGYCFQNRKPWFYSWGNHGAADAVIPFQGVKKVEAEPTPQ